MQVQDIMNTSVLTCRTTDSLNIPAQLMWEHDYGAIPVVSPDGRVAGIITDRDICMAAYTHGQPLTALSVEKAMSKDVFMCGPQENVVQVEKAMADMQILRVPVVDVEGHPFGMVSLSDIAMGAIRPGASEQGLAYEGIVRALAAIIGPRGRKHRPLRPESSGSEVSVP